MPDKGFDIDGLFAGQTGTDYLRSVDTLLRLIKEVSVRQFRDNIPVMSGENLNYVMSHPEETKRILDYLDAEYSNYIGKQNEGFWSTFLPLLEEREHPSSFEDRAYFLSPEAVKLYHALAERHWENLPPGTRKTLTKAHKFSMGEVLAIKNITELDDNKIADEVKIDIDNHSMATRQETEYSYQANNTKDNKKRYELMQKAEDARREKETLIDNIETKLSVYLYKGNKLETTTPLSFSYEFKGHEFAKNTIEEERKILSNPRGKRKKLQFYQGLFAKTPQDVLDLAEKEAAKLSSLNSQFAEMTMKRGMNNISEDEFKEASISLLIGMNETKRRIISELAIYRIKNGELKTKENPLHYYSFYFMTFNKDELDRKAREIGLIDLCPVNIGKHYSTIRKGGLVHEFYLPIDLRGNLRVAFPRGGEDVELDISTDSEICGSRVLDNPNYLEDVLSTLLGKKVSKFDAEKLIEKMMSVGFLDGDKIVNDDEFAAWSVLRGKTIKMTVPKSQLKKVLETAVDVYNLIHPNPIAKQGKEGVSINIVGSRADSITLLVDLNRGYKIYGNQIEQLMGECSGKPITSVEPPAEKVSRAPRSASSKVSINQFVDRLVKNDKRLRMKVFGTYIQRMVEESGQFKEIPDYVLQEAIAERLKTHAGEGGWKEIAENVFDRTKTVEEFASSLKKTDSEKN